MSLAQGSVGSRRTECGRWGPRPPAKGRVGFHVTLSGFGSEGSGRGTPRRRGALPAALVVLRSPSSVGAPARTSWALTALVKPEYFNFDTWQGLSSAREAALRHLSHVTVSIIGQLRKGCSVPGWLDGRSRGHAKRIGGKFKCPGKKRADVGLTSMAEIFSGGFPAHR